MVSARSTASSSTTSSVEDARYLLVGFMAASIGFRLFAGLVNVFGVNWFGSSASSFCLGAFANYLLSARYVFGSRKRFTKEKEIALVFLVSTIGLAANQLALTTLIMAFDLDVLIAKIIAMASVFFWNYAARHYFIFI